MANITGIISEIKMNENPDRNVVNYNEILKKMKPSTINKGDMPLLIETMKPDLLQNNDLQCFTPAQVLWDYITANLFEGTQMRSYFELFLTKFEMGETDKIKYNLSVILYIIENDKEDVMLDLIGLKTSKSELIRALKTNYQNVPLDMCFKFVHFRLLPQIFSKFIDAKDKSEIIDFIMALPMGFSLEFLSAEEKAHLKDDIIKVYLPAIRPDNNISKWWNYCKVLIHYSGKLLHTEIELTNAILRRVEFGFKAKIIESRAGSYECWKVLIENYNLDPKYLRSSKQISLLIKPLKAKLSKNSIVSIKRFDAFTCFIEYLENYSVPCLQEFLSFSFGPFDEDYKKPSDITNNQYFPGRLTQEIYPYTAEILLKLLGHDKKTCACNTENTYLTDVYTIKPFLYGDNINEHYQVFFNSVRICSFMLVEWTQGSNRNVLINCLWDTLFLTIKNCPDASEAVFHNIVTNIKSIIKTCLHYDSYYDILNGILRSVLNYIKSVDYKDEICKDFVYPLAYELCACQIKKPNSIHCNVTPLFNYCKEGIDFYKSVKCLFINTIPKCDLTAMLLKSTVMKISNSNLKADLETKDIINELLIWFLDNDSIECYEVWKTAADGQIISNFLEIKYNLLKAIKHKTLKEKAMDNTNVLQLLGVFLNCISKGDQHFLNDIIITIRYSLKSLTKNSINDHIYILRSLIDIKVKHKFENNRDFCILFVDLLKHEIYSVLPTLKHYIHNLSVFEKNELSKILYVVISGLTSISDKKVSSEVSEILKILDVAEPGIISRGAKIRNMVTSKVTPCGSPKSNLMQLFNESPETIFGSMLNKSPRSSKFSIPNSTSISNKKKVDLNELSDADFVRIDAEVFVDVNKMSEHQKEVASKRRDDIPALYEDLTVSSNDAFQSKPVVIDSQDEKSKEFNTENENVSRKSRKCQVDNGSDDKSEQLIDGLRRKRKRDSDDQTEIRNKSLDVDSDVEITNGCRRLENANEQSGIDSGGGTEPKNKRRRSDKKSNESSQTRRKRADLEEVSLPRSEISTPISSRTKRMFDIPMHPIKLKDKLPNSTSPITIMFKVPLNKSSLSNELPAANNIALEVSKSLNGTEEEQHAKDKETKLNNKNDTDQIGLKKNDIKKADSPSNKGKKVNRFSTNRKDESLDVDTDDMVESDLHNKSTEKVDSPTKKESNEISSEEPVLNVIDKSDHTNSEFHVDVQKETSVSLHIKKIISITDKNNEEQQKSAEEIESIKQVTKPVILEDTKVESNTKIEMPKDINLSNSKDVRSQDNCDDNKGTIGEEPAEDNSSDKPTKSTLLDDTETPSPATISENESPSQMKSQAVKLANKKSRSRRKDTEYTVSRALSLLKMNIVGGDEFQNLPKKRNAKSKQLYDGTVPTPNRKRRSEKPKSGPVENANQIIDEEKSASNQLKQDENKIEVDLNKPEIKSIDTSTNNSDNKESKVVEVEKRLSEQEEHKISHSDEDNKFKEIKSNENDVKKKRLSKHEKEFVQSQNKRVSKQGKELAKNKSVNKEKEPKCSENLIDGNDQNDICENNNEEQGKQESNLNESVTDEIDAKTKLTDLEVERNEYVLDDIKKSPIKLSKLEDPNNEATPVGGDVENRTRINTRSKAGIKIIEESAVKNILHEKSLTNKNDNEETSGESLLDAGANITKENPIPKLEDEAKHEHTPPNKKRKFTTKAGKRSPLKTVIEDVPEKNESIALLQADTTRASPNVIESSLEDDTLHSVSPIVLEQQRINQTSPVPKLHEVRVALFRNNFEKLSPEKIDHLAQLNQTSPLKDTETMEVVSPGDTSVKVSEMDTETMNITEVSEVSLNLVIEKTPERSVCGDSLVSSPISSDTPTRNKELMKNTLDISPIKVASDKKSTPKISPDIFTSQNEDIEIREESFDTPPTKYEDAIESKTSKSETEIVVLKGPSSRSAKLLNLLPQALPIKTHKVLLDSVPRAPQVSSPTTERIKRMMLNCEEQNQVEIIPNVIEEDVLSFIGKDILKFEKEVPSPLATPKVSILKRKPEQVEDGFSGSPCAKRKRVNFSDPPTTSEKIYFKEIEKKSHFKKVKKKSLKKLHYKIQHTATNEQEINKHSEELDDIKPLEETAENDRARVFHFVGQTDMDETEVAVPQNSPNKSINILSNLIIKESNVETKETKTTIKNYNKQMLKMAKNMFSMIKETSTLDAYTEMITNLAMETLPMDNCIKLSAQLLKRVRDRTQETEYSQLITGIVKENFPNESTKYSVQLLEEDMEIVPVDENQATINLVE